jgi:hypothetical protein
MTTLGVKEIEEARVAYTEECIPLVVIAGELGITRQGLWKALRGIGVETRKGVATRRLVKCDVCGVGFEVTRSRLRRMGKVRFCGMGCRDVYLEGGDSFVNRHKQRVARMKVSEVFELVDGNVVHHIDRDHYNTHLSNFLVFRNNADHIKYHHELRAAEIGKGEVTVEPIWSGVYERTKKETYFRPYTKASQLGKK